MSPRGTSRYVTAGLEAFPAGVARAVEAALELDFELSVHPATGGLLAELAAQCGPGALLAETGTGTGVGVAWLASTAPADAHIVSIELDPTRAAAARKVHADDARVEIITGSAHDLWSRGPFDLLVLDGGPGAGKDDAPPIDPRAVLAPTGVVVIDDFTPTEEYPPRFAGEIDQVRLHWLEHPDLATEDRVVAPDMAVLIGRPVGPDARA